MANHSAMLLTSRSMGAVARVASAVLVGALFCKPPHRPRLPHRRQHPHPCLPPRSLALLPPRIPRLVVVVTPTSCSLAAATAVALRAASTAPTCCRSASASRWSCERGRRARRLGRRGARHRRARRAAAARTVIIVVPGCAARAGAGDADGGGCRGSCARRPCRSVQLRPRSSRSLRSVRTRWRPPRACRRRCGSTRGRARARAV